MKFVLEVQCVGVVGNLDDLVKNQGYTPEDCIPVTNSQDVEPLIDFFGTEGLRQEVDRLTSWWTIDRNGNHVAMWACEGIPFLGKRLFELRWQLIDEAEYAYLKRGTRIQPCDKCGWGIANHRREKIEPKNEQETKFKKTSGLTWRVVCIRG